MKFMEEKIGGKTIYKGKILDLTVDDVRLPDGKTAKREIVRHSRGAAALYVRDGEVLLVRQFRYAYGREMYELPAGMVNSGEEPCDSAARELREETGYLAELVPLGFIYPSPGYTDEIIYLYEVTEAEYALPDRDEGEYLDCAFIPLAEVVEMMESGEIADAKTVLAIYKYLLKK